MSEFSIVELGHINLRGDATDGRFTKAVEATLGQPLPLVANTISQSAHRIYWLGPDEWQIVTEPASSSDLVQGLRRELAGQHVSINGLSGGQKAFHLSGPNAVNVLQKGCTLDLHPSVFPVGACAQSGLAKANVLLGCIDKAPVYEIIVRRSFSEYLMRWLRQS
jgi:sarcosine oxidase subunit gamma